MGQCCTNTYRGYDNTSAVVSSASTTSRLSMTSRLIGRPTGLWLFVADHTTTQSELQSLSDARITRVCLYKLSTPLSAMSLLSHSHKILFSLKLSCLNMMERAHCTHTPTPKVPLFKLNGLSSQKSEKKNPWRVCLLFKKNLLFRTCFLPNQMDNLPKSERRRIHGVFLLLKKALFSRTY